MGDSISPAAIVMLSIGFLMVGIMGVIGLQQIANTSTSGWDAAVKTIFTILLPILFVIGIAIRFIPRRK